MPGAEPDDDRRTMNGPDHYREAERLLQEAQSHEGKHSEIA